MKTFCIMNFLLNFMFHSLAISETTTLRLALNWKPEPQFGGFYNAQFKNFFKKEDLKVEILEGGSGTPTIQMLTFGTVDAAIVSAEEILISNDKNPKNQVIAIFATYQTNPQVILTPASRNIKNLEELLSTKGTISAQLGLSYVLYLKKKYPKNNIQWVPYTGGINGLIKETEFAQQGFLTSEPLIAQKKGIEVKSFLISESGFNPYTTVVAVRKSDWDKKTDQMKAFVRALRSGWDDYLKDPVSTHQKLVKMNPSLDINFMHASAQAQLPLIKAKPLGHMNLDRWKSLEATLWDLGLLKKRLKPEDQFISL